MPTPRTFPAVARLRQHLTIHTDPPPTDAELLGRFVTSRDDDAFRELVRRHGPTVLAVCRRVTGNRDDADDAFQAALLVLARKADRVRAGSPLGGWLYGVAVRAARKAVARSARRRSRETVVAELPEIPDRPSAFDPETVRAVLEEVARLSDAHRAAVVLCELEGRSRSAAARELGIAEGTLSSRLAAARKTLARRLGDRGLAPAVLAAVAGSITCPVLAADAARLAGASASPAHRVEELSEAVMRTGFLSKWKVASIAAVVAAAGLVVAAAEPPVPGNPNPPAAIVTRTGEQQPEPKPLPKGPNRLLVWRKGELVMLDPDGTNEKVVQGKVGISPDRCALSPNGKQIAFMTTAGPPIDPAAGPSPPVLHVIGVDKQKEQSFEVAAFSFAWSRSGDFIAFTEFPARGEKLSATHGIINVQTKDKAVLKLPDDHYITDWSRDGQHLVTTRIWPNAGVFLMKGDGSEQQSLTEKRLPAGSYGLRGRLSPDGKRLLFTVVTPKEKDKFGSAKVELAVLDCATGKVMPVADTPLNGQVLGYCWSPDGNRIAYTWVVHDAKPGDMIVKASEAHLVVCDPDGKNARTIMSEKGVPVPINGVDWR